MGYLYMSDTVPMDKLNSFYIAANGGFVESKKYLKSMDAISSERERNRGC